MYLLGLNKGDLLCTHILNTTFKDAIPVSFNKSSCLHLAF